jgi:hypothetical protein
MKISEEEFLEECKKFLEYFDVDYSGDTIILTDGGNSCIMNPNSQWAELFGGHSINGVAQYVAEKLGKQTKWID